MESKQVCDVGAGFYSLLTCKYLLQKGFRPVVFKAGKSIGSIWTSTLRSTQLQALIEGYQFINFWWPELVTGAPNQEQVMNYLEACARQFELIRHVSFGEKVVGLEYFGADREEMETWDLLGGTGGALTGAGRGVWHVTMEKEDGAIEIISAKKRICWRRYYQMSSIP